MAVVFHAHNHTYLNDQSVPYISVTTLIKKYSPPYNQDYWSSYKALKDVLSDAGVWDVYKKKAGGWENVLTFCRNIKNFPYNDAIIQRKKYYILLWKEKGEEARQKGTEFHNAAESKLVEGKVHILDDKREAKVCVKTDIIGTPEFKELSVFPELLIYNDKYRVAGQADYVLKDGNTIHIKDYKTSKEIEKNAFMDETLLFPVNSLPNANFYTYSLQLSIYGYMLECKGYKVGTLIIEHVINDYETKLYPVKYLRHEVILLLKHYAETQKQERRISSAERQNSSPIVSTRR